MSAARAKNYINVSEIRISQDDLTLETVLGSSIAVCLWDGKSLTGGIIHILLPKGPEGKVKEQGKYADTGLPCLVSKMIESGCDHKVLVAKILGGSSAFSDDWDSSLGARNYHTTKKTLEQMKIPIVFEDIGGKTGRHIFFSTINGEVEVVCLSKRRTNCNV